MTKWLIFVCRPEKLRTKSIASPSVALHHKPTSVHLSLSLCCNGERVCSFSRQNNFAMIWAIFLPFSCFLFSFLLLKKEQSRRRISFRPNGFVTRRPTLNDKLVFYWLAKWTFVVVFFSYRIVFLFPFFFRLPCRFVPLYLLFDKTGHKKICANTCAPVLVSRELPFLFCDFLLFNGE